MQLYGDVIEAYEMTLMMECYLYLTSKVLELPIGSLIEY